jgi:hypothetical protein
MDLEINQKVQTYLLGLPENQAKDFELRMSSAGKCRRLIDYELREGQPGPSYEQAIRMARGHALHNMWRAMMQEIYGDGFRQVEEAIDVPIGPSVMTGHPDGVLDDYEALYELKTVGLFTFKMVKNQDRPIPEHYEQGNLYAHVLGTKNVLIHYYEPSQCESLYFLAPYNQTLAEQTIAKFRSALDDHALGAKVSKRPYNDPTASPCWYCHKLETCYDGWKQEVKDMDAKSFEDDALHMSCVEADTMRITRLQCDKKESELKKKVADYLLARKTNKAMVRDCMVSVAVGKNGNPLVKIDRKQP